MIVLDRSPIRLPSPGTESPARLRPNSAAELRAALARLLAYREVFAEDRAADMAGINAAIARHRALLNGEALPEVRYRPGRRGAA